MVSVVDGAGGRTGEWGTGATQQCPHALVKKNVSCASRAGWDCGWNSASKFQKELSTNRAVGISEKPRMAGGMVRRAGSCD